MAMLDSESVFQFQQRVHIIMFALGWSWSVLMNIRKLRVSERGVKWE